MSDTETSSNEQLPRTERARQIQLAVFDVDGVLTDGRLYLLDHGEPARSMHVHDGLGIKRLLAAGIDVAVISARPGAAVAERLHELGVIHIHLDSHDKRMDFEAILAELEITPSEAAIMGDDLPDLALMRDAGLALTVSDAVDAVREHADWVSSRGGGDGAVRQACEWLIDAREAT
ncbi:HAD hydrolase family protein [Salinisphaera sp. USBA-960]|nr:HAD hydrolase family protein [Salifodinibacter halophilus]NNC26780.1 HAD hydrolase family protein [Salifodinibacter halophilus]